ncbi:MAG: hypothetical protein ACREN5_03605 [Gemmatimonadales bacterium]
MSRYTIPAHAARYHVVVGWDAPLTTFFGEVWDCTVPDEDDDAACVLWAGVALSALPTVDALQTCLAAFATIPADVVAQLHQDGATTPPRSPLQAQMLQLLTPRV